jgi:type III restriction enzyme
VPREVLVFEQLLLADRLKGEVEAWSYGGWPGATQTTHDLLHYWFDRTEDSSEKFFLCQRRAIEAVIYCHEILQVRSLRRLYERVAPDALNLSKAFLDEVEASPFIKECLKMATGTGKTWVLIALIVWQYFNLLRNEKPPGATGASNDWYSGRFMIVTPGHEVLNRILDAFEGPKDPNTGLREREDADVKRTLFVPSEWRKDFNYDLLEPDDVRANRSSPEGPFVFITNWQQFQLKTDKQSLWEQFTGEEIEEQPRGEFLLDFLTEHPDIVIMNDEAHHVHSMSVTGKGDIELVWRRFITLLNKRMIERYEAKRRLFLQVDYSATPFFGSGTQKRYFPHIVYDYDLKLASRDMLVKQLFLVEKQAIGGETIELRSLSGQEWKAARKPPESGKRVGELIGLSAGQKTLLQIGKTKLEQIAGEFQKKGIERKPVMLVLCEETAVADLVLSHMATLFTPENKPYDETKVMRIHTALSDKELDEARLRLNKIDENKDPLNVVVSVLMLREGFDRKNICVIVVLRAAEADLLLEQIVGRGLRLMFPQYEIEAIWQEKVEALEAIRTNKQPNSSYDFLFIVEHPRFRAFYDRLKEQGYLIGAGTTTSVTGSVIPVDAIPSRIPGFDLYWPIQIFEQGKFPALDEVGVEALPPYPLLDSFDSFRDSRHKIFVTEQHLDTGKKTATWKLENRYFDYNYFLANATKAIAREGQSALLTGHLAEITEVLDRYVSRYLFGQEIDFSLPQNYPVLNDPLVFDHIVKEVRNRLIKLMGQIRYVRTGQWQPLSSVSRIHIREKTAVDTWKCIYPKQAVAAKGGGFERNFMTRTLESSVEVIAYAKLDKKHALKIPYRDEFGILRNYEIDFLVKTKDSMFLVETKAEKDLDNENVGTKALAAYTWAKSANNLEPPQGVKQPLRWEYVMITDKVYEQSSGSFEALIPTMRSLRDRVIVRRRTQTTLLQPREPRIEDLVRGGEGESLEFKSSLMWDYKLNKPNPALELALAKDLSAFMNSSGGGTLIVGVADNGEILGLEKDMACLTKRPDRDGYEQKLMSLFGNQRPLSAQDCMSIHLSWYEPAGKTVLVIKVDSSNHPVYCKNEQKIPEFYIRAGNTCKPLNVQEAGDYIRDRWKTGN